MTREGRKKAAAQPHRHRGDGEPRKAITGNHHSRGGSARRRERGNAVKRRGREAVEVLTMGGRTVISTAVTW